MLDAWPPRPAARHHAAALNKFAEEWRSEVRKAWRFAGARFLDYMRITSSGLPALWSGLFSRSWSGYRALFAQIVCCLQPPLEFCVQIFDGTDLDLVVKTLGGCLFGLEDTRAFDRAVRLDR